MKTLLKATAPALLATLALTACNQNKAPADQPANDKAAGEKAAQVEKKAEKPADKPADKAAADTQADTKTAEKAMAAEKAKKAEVMTDTAAGGDPLAAPADVAAAPADARKTASGLAYKVIKAGTGAEHPAAADTVSVHYTGWTTDGRMFDSSHKRGEPTSFPLNRVIKGWTEGVQLMKVGEKTRFWIPAAMAYGEKPMRPGAPSGMLVFDIELLSIQKAPEPPKVPEDVAAAPADAKKTASGLAYKVIKAGTGAKKPAATDTVQVHYSGWTTDGRMFDSSVARGNPATFPLNRVIKGWTEGVQLMVEGEKTRFWIPAGLAYGDNPRGGAPAGTLVFDIELLQIK